MLKGWEYDYYSTPSTKTFLKGLNYFVYMYQTVNIT